MTLDALMKHFFRLYGRRDSLFLPSLGKRRFLLNLTISDLQQAIRKDLEPAAIDGALARIVARIFCVAEHFWHLPLPECLIRKYPATHCSYCQQMPCTCPERRPDYQLAPEVAPQQLRWSLSKWTHHFNALYGDRNRQRGIDNLMGRLYREAGELASVQMRLTETGPSLEAIEEAVALELADVLAWTIAVANYLNRDLEQAVLSRFRAGCPTCKKMPCTCCTPFSFKLIEWRE
jgi:NTP pyrophosphatase (non-canonical NTP hydrolase)